MSRDDIIRMALDAGMERVVSIHKDGTRTIELPHPDLLQRFAALVAAAEREAIAQMIENAPSLEPDVQNKRGGCLICGFTPTVAAKVIRARSTNEL